MPEPPRHPRVVPPVRGLEPPQIELLARKATEAGVAVEPWLAWARITALHVGVIEATRRAIEGIATEPTWADPSPRRRWRWQAGGR